MTRGRRLLAAVVLSFCAVSGPASAFDTAPHTDITRDALTAEGFGAASASIAAVNNWFVDYYTNLDKNPYSGHASFLIGVTRLGLARESWPDYWVEGARRMHFDAERRAAAMPNLAGTAGVEREWDRLIDMSRRLLRHAARENDPLLVLSTIGMTLHSVQDF